jgi:hypothetical protein
MVDEKWNQAPKEGNSLRVRLFVEAPKCTSSFSEREFLIMEIRALRS